MWLLVSTLLTVVAATLSPTIVEWSAHPTRDASNVDDDQGVFFYYYEDEFDDYACGKSGCTLKIVLDVERALCVNELFIYIDKRQYGNMNFDVYIKGDSVDTNNTMDGSDFTAYKYAATYYGTKHPTDDYTVFQGADVCMMPVHNIMILTGDIFPNIMYTTADVENQQDNLPLQIRSIMMKTSSLSEHGEYNEIHTGINIFYKHHPTPAPTLAPTLSVIKPSQLRRTIVTSPLVECGRRIVLECVDGRIDHVHVEIGRNDSQICDAMKDVHVMCGMHDATKFISVRCTGRKQCSIALRSLAIDVGIVAHCSPYALYEYVCI